METGSFTLYIDTSIHKKSFAVLFFKDELVWRSASTGTEDTWEFLETVYRQSKKKIEAAGQRGFCDAIYLGLGPGSFVGIREGLSFVQALHCSSGSALYFFSSLELLFSSSQKNQVAFRDARSGGVYLQKKEKGDSISPERVSLEDFACLWKSRQKDFLWCALDEDIQKIGERFEQTGLLQQKQLDAWYSRQPFSQIDPVAALSHLQLVTKIPPREEGALFPKSSGDADFLEDGLSSVSDSVTDIVSGSLIEPFYLQPKSHYKEKGS